MLRRPHELAVEANHVSWAHMASMMFAAQIGFAAIRSDLLCIFTGARPARQAP